MKLFYRKKKALLRTFYELDKKMKAFLQTNEQESTELDDVSVDSDGNFSVKSHMFEGHDEDKLLTKTREDSYNRDTLMSLMFTGFEHSMKCPFSKVYSDVNYLYPCCFPDEPCKNGRYHTLETLLQHVESKRCAYHDVLGKYISYFIEDKNDDCVKELIRRKREDRLRELNETKTTLQK